MNKTQNITGLTHHLLQDVQQIIESSGRFAWQAVNVAMLQRNWLLGKRIAEEELQGENRAKYGAEIIKNLAVELTKIYGNGFNKTNLYQFTEFYKAFPNIFHTVCGKSETGILDTVCPKSHTLLTWSHYRTLLQVNDADAREWYAKEAATEIWSVRTLQRNISSQYYYRILKSPDKNAVKKEMQQLTSSFQQDKLEFIKNPVVAEFLGFSQNSDFTENDLEKSIIGNLQQFLIELGKGYAFVARQQHIRTEKQDYFIDLVFYNYMLKCFVLVDLKTSKITHQDVGQMDMYVRMYDELRRTEGDNPTIGILLCADTDEDIARFSILHGNEQLFASKYKTYLPTEEELRAEIETQKRMFYLQQAEKDGKNG
jgi:predicted nuclease of restriction endonuclease-like (RecB) superfamily